MRFFWPNETMPPVRTPKPSAPLVPELSDAQQAVLAAVRANNGAKRAVLAKALNTSPKHLLPRLYRLCAQGHITKSETRPARFYLKEKPPCLN